MIIRFYAVLLFLFVIGFSSNAQANIILSPLGEKLYEIELTETLNFTMTADVATFGAWRVVNFFETPLTPRLQNGKAITRAAGR